MQIKNKEGKVIHEGDRSKQYGDLDLRNAVFEGLTLQGHTSMIPISKVQIFERPIYIGATSFSRILLQLTLKAHNVGR
jgi:hypothetical protein